MKKKKTVRAKKRPAVKKTAPQPASQSDVLQEDAVKEFYRKILMLQEEERRRISRDLHDETGQTVVALGASLNILEKALIDGRTERAIAIVNENRKLIQEIAAKMKAMALNLRPPTLDILGLSAVLREYFSQCTKSNMLRIEFDENIKDVKLNENMEISVYRIVQEAIYNVIKHAQATTVNVNLTFQKNSLTLVIKDNGRGFNMDEYRKEQGAGKMGLHGIKERVEIMKGTLHIESEHKHGTTLTAHLPV